LTFLVSDSKPSAGEAERSGKLEYCAAFNETLPAQQRLETLLKVCALAFAFSIVHIQRAALRSAQRYTAPSVAQRAALHCAQRYTAPSAALRPALHCAQRCTARSIAQRPAIHRAACSTVSRVGVWAGPQLPCADSDVALS